MPITLNGSTGVTAAAFAGSGSTLTSLPAAQLTGSIDAARLTSVPSASLTGDVAAARITTALNASGSAPIYACRAWVNFDGTGTVAIRASGNVSSITDNGIGNYTVNFTTAMPDANYCADISFERDTTGQANVRTCSGYTGGRTTSSFRLVTEYSAGSGVAIDMPAVYLSIFR